MHAALLGAANSPAHASSSLILPLQLPFTVCLPLASSRALQVHCARFFYGPMLQGRDGIGAAPCCGTGVVFRRDILVSIGGQAYGSITEDYNTAMTLLSAGFATM